MSSMSITPLPSPIQMQEDLLLNPTKESSIPQTLDCRETYSQDQETPPTVAELIALAKQSETEEALKIYSFALSQNISKLDQLNILVRKFELLKKTNSAEAMKDSCAMEDIANKLFKGRLNDETTAIIFYDRAKIYSDQQLYSQSLKYFTEAEAAYLRLNDTQNAQICLSKINNIQKNNSQRS